VANFLFTKYITILTEALKTVDVNKLEEIKFEINKRIDGNGEIHIIGNGGSCANAHHIVGDYMKSFAFCGKRLKINCLSDNSCYLTAAANDLDYSKIYEILVNSRINKSDLLIVLSGSGNSLNLVKAIRAAKSKGIKTAGIVSYSGGALLDLLDIPIYVRVNDMEISEDSQLSIFHFIKQSILKEIGDGQDQIIKYKKRVSDDLIA
tara:strand:+ start:1590 stop:2207 length:618 start_codon:yes stop_codon:yes gene_type:complete